MSEEQQKAIVNLFILDASYSMGSIKSAIIEGFNTQAKQVRELADELDIPSFAGLISFSSGVDAVKTHFMAESADKLLDLNHENYVCNGGTALYDAIGEGVKQLDEKLGHYLTACNVVVTVLTDGEENSSNQYCGPQIADLIQEYQEEYGWTFNFIGANIDVETLASTLNISTGNTLCFAATAEGTSDMMDTYSRSVKAYYTSAASGDDVKSVTDFMVKD